MSAVSFAGLPFSRHIRAEDVDLRFIYAEVVVESMDVDEFTEESI